MSSPGVEILVYISRTLINGGMIVSNVDHHIAGTIHSVALPISSIEVVHFTYSWFASREDGVVRMVDDAIVGGGTRVVALFRVVVCTRVGSGIKLITGVVACVQAPVSVVMMFA